MREMRSDEDVRLNLGYVSPLDEQGMEASLPALTVEMLMDIRTLLKGMQHYPLFTKDQLTRLMEVTRMTRGPIKVEGDTTDETVQPGTDAANAAELRTELSGESPAEGGDVAGPNC